MPGIMSWSGGKVNDNAGNIVKFEFSEPFAVGTTAKLESRQGRKRAGRGKPAQRAQPLLTNKR